MTSVRHERDRMASFLLVMGWIVLIGAPVVTLFVIAMSILEGFELHMVARLILMPFVFLWGLRQVRRYRQQGTGN